jgi:hypothetical protein
MFPFWELFITFVANSDKWNEFLLKARYENSG